MSWKSFVSAGLLCALAVPAFAAPTVQVVPGGTAANGHLDANGDWVWRVNITPDYADVDDGSGTPLGAELGFTESSAAELLSAIQGAGFDTVNPGKVIFGWETISDTDGVPGIGPNDEPLGVQSNLTADQVFAALGSANLTSGAAHFLTITVDGPTATSATSSATTRTTTLQMSGAYGGNGRVAQVTGGTSPNYITSNFDTFNGSFTRVATPGDANLAGGVSLTDLSTVLNNFGVGTTWQAGNFKGTGTVSLTDLSTVLNAFGQPSGAGTGPGGGSGGGGAVPEPSTLALFALGFLGSLGLARRHRS